MIKTLASKEKRRVQEYTIFNDLVVIHYSKLLFKRAHRYCL